VPVCRAGLAVLDFSRRRNGPVSADRGVHDHGYWEPPWQNVTTRDHANCNAFSEMLASRLILIKAICAPSTLTKRTFRPGAVWRRPRQKPSRGHRPRTPDGARRIRRTGVLVRAASCSSKRHAACAHFLYIASHALIELPPHLLDVG